MFSFGWLDWKFRRGSTGLGREAGEVACVVELKKAQNNENPPKGYPPVVFFRFSMDLFTTTTTSQ
jgi:hypothetical protein